MKRRTSVGFFALVTALAVAAAIGLAVQWQRGNALRAEITLARIETAELERLRSENRELRQKQIPDLEIARLRADHAALPRLRAELQELAKGANAGRR